MVYKTLEPEKNILASMLNDECGSPVISLPVIVKQYPLSQSVGQTHRFNYMVYIGEMQPCVYLPKTWNTTVAKQFPGVVCIPRETIDDCALISNYLPFYDIICRCYYITSYSLWHNTDIVTDNTQGNQLVHLHKHYNRLHQVYRWESQLLLNIQYNTNWTQLQQL